MLTTAIVDHARMVNSRLLLPAVIRERYSSETGRMYGRMESANLKLFSLPVNDVNRKWTAEITDCFVVVRIELIQTNN